MAECRDDVPDIVAEVFAVAWRRMDAMPYPPRDRLWLYGVARRVVLDHQRRAVRNLRLESWLKANAPAEPDAPVRDPVHLRLREAVERLPPLDREALRLVAWDGLSTQKRPRCSAAASTPWPCGCTRPRRGLEQN
jgi:RNA polymerase sigma-70 factor (ECF subfamily)